VVFLGGMVDVFRAEETENAWRRFDAITASLGVPVHNAASDCSLNPLALSSDTIKLARKMYSDRYNKRFYSFEHRNSLFILLDSDYTGQPGEKDEDDLVAEQARFLGSTLTLSAGRDNIFVFQNATPSEENSSASPWFKYIHPLLIDKARYVFTSGEHSTGINNRDGVNYVTSGVPPCRQMRAENPAFFHFLLVTVAAGKVSINVVPVGSIPIEYLGGQQKKNSSSKFGRAAKPYILEAAEREKMLPPGVVVKALGIKPGTTILDIGAGRGLFTFPFAEALGGAGRVFATDIDPEMISSLKTIAGQKGYKNVFPVQVAAEGVDPFYKTGTFDIIFLAETYHYLWRPVEYFRELRRSLAKETGRLYIIHFKNVHDFDAVEFDDFVPILKRLKKLEDGSPFFKKTAAGIEDYVRNWQGEDIPPFIRKIITDNFNGILADRTLLNELLDSYQSKRPDLEWVWGKPILKSINARDIQLAKWLIAELDDRGVFDKERIRITKDEEEHLRALNRVLLTGTFGIDKIYHLKGPHTFYSGKSRIVTDMEAAGYTLVREHDQLTYYHFLEFKNAGN
jgi:ubiquinone/menaquinone biosynthesis C-methylase UbiE